MKVICDRAALAETLNLVGAVIVTRTPKEVLKCVKLTASDRVLTVSGTDLEVAIRLSTEKVEIQQEGEVLLPAEKLGQIFRESLDPTLTLHIDGDQAVIRGADSRFTIYGYPAADFPAWPDAAESGLSFDIDAGQLTTLISRTIFATARENSRYAINGVLMKREGNKLKFVATDGRRLAMACGTCKAGGDGETTCIIPTKALNLLLKIAADPEQPVNIATTENQAIFRVGKEEDGPQALLATNLVEGAFPPFEDVIPKDLDKTVRFDVDTLSSAVRRAALLTNEESKGVRMNFQSGQLTITSRAPELGEAEIKVPLEGYEGDDLEIGFNPGFIIDALKVVDTPEIGFDLGTANKPGTIRCGTEFLYVLMPVSLK